MTDEAKKREKLQSRRQDENLREGAEPERETTMRPGTAATERIKPASKREVSPNTPPGEEQE